MSESFDPKGRPVSRKQAASKGMDDGWTVTGTLITGIAFWGFVGWALSRWTGWVGFFPIGVVLGAAAGVYLVYKQAGAPPPLLDISRNQDGGLPARHAKRLAAKESALDAGDDAPDGAADLDEQQRTTDTDQRGTRPPGPRPGEDERHTDSPKD